MTFSLRVFLLAFVVMFAANVWLSWELCEASRRSLEAKRATADLTSEWMALMAERDRAICELQKIIADLLTDRARNVLKQLDALDVRLGNILPRTRED